ncbi:TPA: acyltransferase [Enterobacter hormaechei]|jgi:peptidoglycan/LPS O-acetylase OafA/YrhL|uniref:acyltransferase family protein n=3 Tax=Enterobacter hormaechei TaxID=158836 RepID=UPI002FD233B8|nr:acyltransferase [Enterobacter hormaechei]HBL5382406.1 acyltransferase [Enterobacter hormaechei]HBL8803416.1 acyltransferase [Enterobacter hormaechei]
MMHYIKEYAIYFTVLLLTVSIVSKILKIEPDTHKYSSFDGARGICASLVAIFHIFWRDGGPSTEYWSLDYISSSRVVHYILLTGELSVGMFFILSAFLFFKKAMAKTFDYERFYVSRILRIYPPVAFSILMVYAASYAISVNHSYQINDLIQSLPSLFNYPMTRINDIPLAIMNSGVLWTMVWELRLYVAIPIIFIILKRFPYPKAFVLLSMAYIVYQWYFVSKDIELSYTMYFLAGFMVATVNKEVKLHDALSSIVLFVSVILIGNAYDVITPLLMMIVFYTLKCGCTYFGILTCKPIRVLGACSFSIYLIHGIPQAVSKHYFYDDGNMIWKLISIIAIGVIAPVMYKYIEKPTMNASLFTTQKTT